MANEGIMALPQGMGMQGATPRAEKPTVTSADSYDAVLTALNITDPQQFEMFKRQIRGSFQGAEIPPQELTALIGILERLVETPEDYPEFAQLAQADGMDVPDQFDPEFVGALIVVLNELQMGAAETAQDVATIGPVVEGLQPAQFAEGGLADMASYLRSQGRGGDTVLAHITPGEASMLQSRGGAGTINPVTGLPEYGWLSKAWKSITGAVKSVVKGVINVVKDVLKSPIGRILGTIALATVLGPTALGMSLGTAGTAAVASGAVTLAAGGSFKDALVSGAMGYFGGGGTIGGVNPVASLGSYLPGAAGSALNVGLSTGVLGAGIGKLSGMSTADALKMGLTSGVGAAGMTALQGTGPASTEGGGADAPTESGGGGGTVDAPGQVGTAGEVGSTGQVGSTGEIGTAADLLAGGNQQYSGSGLKMPAMGSSTGFDAAGNFKADYSLAGAPSAPVPGMEGAMGTGLRAPVSPAMTPSGAANYSLSSVPSAAQPAGFVGKMVSGAKDLYNEYLSPTRLGLPADAGVIQKYGPLALAGTAVMAATGGMEGEPANQNPAFNRNYTGSDYMRDNPDKFKGGLSSYTKPETPDNPIVPTPSYATIPIGAPGTVVPTGVTMSPGGVAQPYNVAGLYGVPLIYGPDGQPRRMAKGGDAQMTHFPRKNGPINGPGTGTSDDIPAMLSDGEFVFTAKAVRNAGGGSRRKGAARMYKMMKMLEGGAVKGK
jgi:hypothetical protein